MWYECCMRENAKSMTLVASGAVSVDRTDGTVRVSVGGRDVSEAVAAFSDTAVRETAGGDVRSCGSLLVYVACCES